jgi:hypothetical protein
MKNIKEYQSLNTCFQWIVMTVNVEISSSENSARESRLTGSFKNYDIYYLSKHTKPKTYATMIKPIVLCGCETWAMTEQMK